MAQGAEIMDVAEPAPFAAGGFGDRTFAGDFAGDLARSFTGDLEVAERAMTSAKMYKSI